MFEKHGPYEKKFHQQNYLIFNFTMVSENFIHIGQLGTDIQNFEEVRLISYHINLFEKYE